MVWTAFHPITLGNNLKKYNPMEYEKTNIDTYQYKSKEEEIEVKRIPTNKRENQSK